MPRVANLRAVTTRESITNLWALAERDGEVTIRVADRAKCYAIRNKLYAHRGLLRKRASAHTGIEASHLDGYKITYREEWEEVWEQQLVHNPDSASGYSSVDPLLKHKATGKWILTISFEDMVEFEILLPPDYDEASLPHFDTYTDLEQGDPDEEV